MVSPSDSSVDMQRKPSDSKLTNAMFNMSLNNNNNSNTNNNLASQLLGSQQPVYSMRLRNLPLDISLRELYAIFALSADLVSCELVYESNEQQQSFPLGIASFRSLSSIQQIAAILDGKLIFGPNTYPVRVDTEEVLTNNTSIMSSPVMGNSITQTVSNSFLPALASPPHSASSITNTKRPSLGAQRSRFLFQDPFSNAETDNNLIGNSGKSLLMMEAQNDAREYDQLVRGGPWISAPNSNHYQVPMSAPPSSSSNVDLDYRRRQGSAFFSSQQNQPQHPTQPAQPQSQPQQQQQQQQQQSAPPQNQPLSQKNSVPDLSLLARVPPPANPADQNPPCNTLYVGNLPPDATEAELRALFQPQKGFRRLSFRTKSNSSSSGSTTSSHSHGPMCFVEFEDVAHATRALAELYGRALPRPGGMTGKGGIRLSFSKNPLGVRGPSHQQRRTTTAAQPQYSAIPNYQQPQVAMNLNGIYQSK